MALKLLRTLRLDASDDVVFERAAPDGEIAVPGGFQFMAEDPAALTGRRRQAFRSGFLGLGSFGFSTLAVVASVTESERDAAVEALATHLVAAWGAPDLAVARTAAAEEIAFSESLAEPPEGTVIALTRAADENGGIRESFRTLHRTEPKEDFSRGLFRAIAAVPDDGPADPVDLHALAARKEPT
jgi:hypothetical protein